MNRSLIAIIAAKLLVGIPPAASAAFLIGALLCHGVADAALMGQFVPVATNLNIPPNVVFEAGGNVDTYKVKVTNTGDNATSVEMAFTGDFFQFDGVGATFRNDPSIPAFFGNHFFPDSFFILPDAANVLAVDTVDTTAQLSSSFTLPGDTVILPGNGAKTTIAFLTVPAGNAMPVFVSGRAAIGGAFEDIVFGTGTPPEAVGDPQDGETISMQGAFDDGTGLLAQAIMITNGNPGSDFELMFDASSLVFTSNDENLFSAAINGSDPSKIDLMIDVAAAKNGPGRDVAAVLEVRTNGDTLSYNLTARVPEPSTFALAGLALVGLVGFARRVADAAATDKVAQHETHKRGRAELSPAFSRCWTRVVSKE